MQKKEVLEESDVIFLEEFIYHTSNFLKKNYPKQPLKPGAIINYYVLEFRAQARTEGLKGIITFETIVNNLMEIVDAIKGSDDFEHAGARPDLFLLQLNRIRDLPQYLTFIDERRNKIAIKPFEINDITLANGKTPSETLNDFHSAILFSATIGDPKLFRRELGLKEAELFKTESMPHEKLLVLIDTELDTTFRNRPKNAPKYLDKIETIRGIDPSLLISCCNQIEADKILEGIPDLERAELESNLHAEQSYVLNIRTKHARSTNKAKNTRNCIIVGLPLPDYSDFYFQQRKKFLEKKYGKMQAGKMINRKAIDTAVQLMGRITRNLEHPKTITLADRRYRHDFFLGDFYFDSIPEYIKPYLKTVNNNQMLKKELDRFWKDSDN